MSDKKNKREKEMIVKNDANCIENKLIDIYPEVFFWWIWLIGGYYEF